MSPRKRASSDPVDPQTSWSSLWTKRIGPLLDAETVDERLKAIQERLGILYSRSDLFVVRAPDGSERFPEVQFDESGRPLPGLASIIESFGENVEPLTIASWLTTGNERLEGRAPVEWLRDRQFGPV